MKLPTFTSRKNGLRSGFTLVELLTVIAIIAILAAIIIPVTGKVREKARGAQCVSNLREIGRAMLLYAGENKNTYPLHGVMVINPPGPPAQPATVEWPLEASSVQNWMRYISGYINVQSRDQLSHVLSCPNVIQDRNTDRNYSYLMNRFLVGRKTTSPVNPSKTVLVRHTGQGHSASIAQEDKEQSPTGLNYSDSSGKFNYLFADGHVAMHTPLVPFNPHWYVAP